MSLSVHADQKPTFFRAINLNGPAIVIDDHRWEAGEAAGIKLNRLSSFNDQTVRLLPTTDEARTQMIRSSVWSPSGSATFQVQDLPAGLHSVYLYVWEDNDAQTFDVKLQERTVVNGHASGDGGHWHRLGPWVVDVTDGVIQVSASGGHANLSGIEIWRGELTASDNLLPTLTAPKMAKSIESDVAMLFAQHCLECHNSSEIKSGLDLTQRATALSGGENGRAIVPEDPANSLLLQYIESGEMPPGDARLPEEKITLLRQWIQGGAKYAADPIDPFLYSNDRRAGYNWWSLQPLRPVAAVAHEATKKDVVPSGQSPQKVADSIDEFVDQALAEKGVQPAPDADRRTLIRRLTFDLSGLPPTPEEVSDFIHDTDPDAYERLVDRLLESPHYGERWARHWLDIVRYGGSQGFERNKLRPNVWKYRDFVVEAFNSDMPYDQFIRWQLAGDVLSPNDPLAVIASGFLAIGPYDLTAYNNGTPDMRALAREEELESLVGAVGQTFLGLTINCSRCHDHKFDPITQRDFYQISAALGGTFQGNERECLTEAGKPDVSQRLATLRDQIAALRSQESGADNTAKRKFAADRARLESVIGLLEGGPVHTTLPKQPGAWRILARGDFKLPGDVVVPQGIVSVTGVSPDWGLDENAPEADRRKKLADWIADPANPLTPRVLVNRLWGYHFGEGLVRTPSDFGFQGGLPSHPELLDWLARQLVHPSEGPAWSLKRIQRLIVSSAAYRRSSQMLPDAAAVDADNRLLWRNPPQRLDAETFRDTVLSVSGDLNLKLGGPGYRDFKLATAGDNDTYTVFDAIGPEFNRRSLYRTWVRSGTSPLLDCLDCPDPSVPTPRRSVTSTPLQALSLLNDSFVEHSAQRLAERLRREAGDDPASQVERCFMLAIARQPDSDEESYAVRFIAAHGLAQFCVVMFNTNEFLFVD